MNLTRSLLAPFTDKTSLTSAQLLKVFKGGFTIFYALFGHKLSTDTLVLQALVQGEVVPLQGLANTHINLRRRTIVFVLKVISGEPLPSITICGFSLTTFFEPRKPGALFYVWTWPHKGILLSAAGHPLPQLTFRVLTSFLLLLTLYASKTTSLSTAKVYIGKHHSRAYQWATFIQGLPLLYRDMGVRINLVTSLLYNCT